MEPSDTLEDDYGVIGDDAHELINSFATRLNVLQGDFEFLKYFHMEGSAKSVTSQPNGAPASRPIRYGTSHTARIAVRKQSSLFGQKAERGFWKRSSARTARDPRPHACTR
ncbi:DUF1493 family protein [Paraburkholderia sp. MMS20-SJTR3]|uniref:DUF1493 family protein n=1 Tax=Paraburkholderia sejongensis TaxID=2886946 RepID=A0ABS8K2J4_9BURK|nr:DUF1493 family protein [Paraburkholderia sp. MMS20-SJTR3]MCC8396376.1 DUF1493 family protein [Paraburkholderia sp. MMS20-SJTR3]